MAAAGALDATKKLNDLSLAEIDDLKGGKHGTFGPWFHMHS